MGEGIECAEESPKSARSPCLSENRLWKWLRSGVLPERGSYSRIETGDTCPGVPDVYYRFPEGNGWLELKFDRHPSWPAPFHKDDDGLHLSQRTWIADEVRKGGRVFVVAELEKRVIWMDMRITHAANYNDLSRIELFDTASLVLTKPMYRSEAGKIEALLYQLMTS
jgi:hypothetical protein